MNQELKTKWAETLRSGEYEQGREALRGKENRFCCLDVLCDMVDPEGWGEKNVDGWLHRGEAGYPVYSLLDEVGLAEDKTRRLAELNDDGQPFACIADWIEENVE